MRNAIWAPLEIAINRLLGLDAAAPARMASLEGKTLAIELRGVPVAAYVLFCRERINVLGEFSGAPDTRIVGTPLSLARIAIGGSGPQTLFGKDIELHGDVDVARRAKAILDELDIDWEEQLARITGDVAAHQIGNVVRGTLGWSKSLLATLGQDITEYLQEESNTLPTEPEVRAFAAEVDRLRSDADRLVLRVQRLVRAMPVAGKPTDSRATPVP